MTKPQTGKEQAQDGKLSELQLQLRTQIKYSPDLIKLTGLIPTLKIRVRDDNGRVIQVYPLFPDFLKEIPHLEDLAVESLIYGTLDEEDNAYLDLDRGDLIPSECFIKRYFEIRNLLSEPLCEWYDSPELNQYPHEFFTGKRMKQFLRFAEEIQDPKIKEFARIFGEMFVHYPVPTFAQVGRAYFKLISSFMTTVDVHDLLLSDQLENDSDYLKYKLLIQ